MQLLQVIAGLAISTHFTPVLLLAEAAPTPPTFAPVFESNFSGIDTTHGYSYAGWWVWDMNQQMDRQDSWHTSGSHRSIRGSLPQDQPSFRQIDIDKWPALQSFFYCPYQSPPLCQQLILVPPMRPFAVPTDSTYKGTEPCGGTIDPAGTCDVWEYVFSASGGKKWVTTYWVGTMDSGPGGEGAAVPYPSRIAYTGDQPNVFVNWTSYAPVPQVPPSDFTVPPSWDCQPGAGAAAQGLLPADQPKDRRAVRAAEGKSPVLPSDVAGTGRRPGAPWLPASEGAENVATCPPSDGVSGD